MTVANISTKLREAASRAEQLVTNLAAAQSSSKLVLKLGNEEIKDFVLGDLNPQNKTYLMEKVLEQLHELRAQMVNL